MIQTISAVVASVASEIPITICMGGPPLPFVAAQSRDAKGARPSLPVLSPPIWR